jgi:hypothetical protein
MDTFKNYLVSLIRTAVPLLVGFVTSWLATRHININQNGVHMLTLAFEGLAGMVYYLVVRVLEHVNYRFGWLLGYAKMPTYIVTPEQVDIQPVVHAPTGDPLDDLYKDEINQGPVPRMGQ